MGSVIESSLEAAQLVHRLLLSVCAALLLFALSAKAPPNEYEAAQAEFRSIQPTLQKAYDAQAADVFRYYDENGVVPAIREALPGVKLSPRLFTGWKEDHQHAPLPTDDLEYASTYLGYSRNYETLQVFSLDVGDVRSWAGILRTNPPLDSLLEIRILAFPEPPPGFVMSGFGDTVRLAARYRFANGDTMTHDLGPVRFSGKTSLRSASAEHVFAESKLFDAAGNPLPALHAVWDEVAKLRMDQAPAFLEHKARDARRNAEPTVSVLGFDISSRLLIGAGPILVLALMVYLLAHLYHLLAIADRGPEELRTHPWMGVPTSRLGAWLLYGSISVLPLASVLWIVEVSALPMTSRRLVEGGFAALFVVTLVFVVLALRALAKASRLPAEDGAPA